MSMSGETVDATFAAGPGGEMRADRLTAPHADGRARTRRR
jgi:hypothetical protein